MREVLFPIVETKENRLIALDGHESALFRVLPPDLEQHTLRKSDHFFDGISRSLNQLSEQDYIRFYSLNAENYLQMPYRSHFDLLGCELVPEEKGLEAFFSAIDLYSNLCVFDDYINFNGFYWRVFSISEFPENSIGPFPFPLGLDYVLNIKKKSAARSVRELERIRTGHLASFLKPKRDLQSEGTYEQAEDLLLDLTHNRESLFEIEVFFLLMAHSIEELSHKSNELQKEMSLKGYKLFLEGQSLKKLKSGLGEIFSELIPGCTPKLSLRTHTDKTTHLRYLIPLRRSHLMKSGMTFHDGHGSPIFFNPFDKSLINRNMLVTGTTGSGKSVFVNKLVHSLAGLYPVVIIDKDGSFKKTTLYHNGVVLEGGFNPLQFRDPLYLREFILSLCDEKGFNLQDKGRLLKAIKNALEGGVRNLDELLDHLESDFSGISYYFEECRGAFGGNEIPIEKILYVDIDKYPKGIVAPLIIFLLEYFKNIPEREKVLVFDECWSFLKKHANYIDECFRTFRKKGSFPIAISQSLNDFKKNIKGNQENGDELFSSITNTTHFKIIFPQELEVSNEISSFDIENVHSLLYEKGHFSECYLKTTDNKMRKIVRLYLSPLEYELFHTEDGEEDRLLKFLKDNKKYFNSNQECIDAYVRLKHGQL